MIDPRRLPVPVDHLHGPTKVMGVVPLRPDMGGHPGTIAQPEDQSMEPNEGCQRRTCIKLTKELVKESHVGGRGP